MECEDGVKMANGWQVRVRMLGNIKFIGELFSFKILNEKIMHEYVLPPAACAGFGIQKAP